MKTLPAEQGYFHSLSFGMDYKNFVQDVNAGGGVISSPIQYYPFTLSYRLSRVTENTYTEFNAGLTWHLAGMAAHRASSPHAVSMPVTISSTSRGDVSHTHDLPEGLQLYTRVQGQASEQALINTEQIAGGGLNTVRGYLIATQLGDSGVFGTL
jgi:hemolysin activation/secretion protein